jgi:hypothetical protein
MDKHELRRENFNAVIDRLGGQAVFIEKTNMNQGQISALQNGGRNMGEKLARKIEEMLELVPGSLDVEGGAGQDPIRVAIEKDTGLTPNEKATLIQALKTFRENKQMRIVIDPLPVPTMSGQNGQKRRGT